jgi:hypothetical protein
MENIIKELQISMDHELRQIGLTPRTNFKGSQDEHDNYHRSKADEYRKAIEILSAKFMVRDWMVSETHSFDNFDNANDFYIESVKLCNGGDTDIELYCVIKAINNVD